MNKYFLLFLFSLASMQIHAGFDIIDVTKQPKNIKATKAKNSKVIQKAIKEAIEENDFDALKPLLEQEGIDINQKIKIVSLTKNYQYFTSYLKKALLFDSSIDIISLLLEKGATIENLDDINTKEILMKAIKAERLDIIEKLVSLGMKIKDKNNLLSDTLKIDNPKIVDLAIIQYLVEQGSDITQKDSDGFSLLEIAIFAHPIEVVKYFEEKTEDNIEGIELKTDLPSLLHLAALNKDLRVIEYIRSKTNLDINQPITCENYDITNITPLHYAIKADNIKTAQYLIQHGACINAQTSKGETPLSLSIDNENLTMMKVLLQLGANTDITDNEGKNITKIIEEPISFSDSKNQ
ncbi:hypothetical protein COB28_00370 [Candidatus Dependentiae bacterium]|nr:MAG: hypothetical protein COB28_00370 [Candidatus Dependentiae bacterium]